MKWLGRSALVLAVLLALYVSAFFALFNVSAPLHGANWPTPRSWIALHLYGTRWFWDWDGWAPLVRLWLLTK